MELPDPDIDNENQKDSPSEPPAKMKNRSWFDDSISDEDATFWNTPTIDLIGDGDFWTGASSDAP